LVPMMRPQTLVLSLSPPSSDRRDLPSFPTRRSSDLRERILRRLRYDVERSCLESTAPQLALISQGGMSNGLPWMQACRARDEREDRKSTRLNSSHVKMSYAVLCLKKKTKLKASRAPI